MRNKTMIALLALVMAVVIAACGDDESGDNGSAEGEDAVTLAGSFEVVQDAPDGSEGITGTAEQVRSNDGTEVSIELSGLMPDTEYIAHVHAGACDQPDPGGPHYMFDLDGSEMPPNEIHLPFTSDAGGEGSAQAANEQRIPDGEGMSVVVHLADGSDDSHEHSEDEDHGAGMGQGEHMDGEKEMEKDEHADGDEGMEESGDSHSGRTHMPKLACAQLS